MKKAIYIISAILMVTIFSLSSIAQPWTWSEDTLSYARSGMSAATIDDTIFYSGGMTNGTFSNIWDIYDIGEDQWDTYETSSNLRWNSATVSAGGKVFSAGGSNYPNWDNFDDVDIYDKETGVWTVENLTLGRTITGGAVACGNKVFFAGGHIHTGPGPMTYTNRIDIYDTETESWFEDSLSIKRCFIGAVAAGGKVYFAGGATGEQAVTNRIDIYNMETGEWTMDSLSEARAFIAAIAYGDKIYFAGGSKPYNVTSTLIEVYNITSGDWIDTMNLQTTRIVTALNVKNSLVFTGVCNYLELTGVINIGPSNGVVEIYYPETNQWEYSVTNLNPARVLYAYISYGNKAYYAGGGISAMTDKINILEYFGQCLPEGITFSTQEEIDNFQSNYPGCTEIEGDVTINGDDINNLNGLDVLASIGGSLIIENCESLNDLMGLDNLASVNGDIIIKGNDSLTSLTGLENLTFIEGDFRIGMGSMYSFNGNISLISLAGLESLASIGGGLSVIGNHSLYDLTGLDNLSSIGDFLEIGCNDSLTILSGLENITTIEGDLIIGWWSITQGSAGNNSLTSLTGLNNLSSVGGHVWIGYNPLLNSLNTLDNLTIIGGGLGITNNDALTNLNGLNNLTFIGGLIIWYNNALSSFSGLDSLISVGGNLDIGSNEVLTSISNLNGVTSLGGNLQITNNNSLTSLSGLENIEVTTIADLTITNNDALYDCDIWSICQYLNGPGGTVVIENNATECNSIEEVEAHCLTSIDELAGDDSFSFSPNPNSGFINIRFANSEKGLVILDLHNISGIRIKRLLSDEKIPGTYEMEIDLSDLPNGVYFCLLKTNEGIQTKKIIKL